MTPTEQWIIGLAMVYSVPSFLSGIGMTLLFVRWPEVRRAMAMMPRFLSPALTLERRDFKTIGAQQKGLDPV
jgi:hypothetical protein